MAAIVAVSGGCTAFFAPTNPYPVTPPDASPQSTVPRELEKISLPPYVIEPPDILMINAVKVVPKPPHKIEPFDGLLIRVLGRSARSADCRRLFGRSRRQGRPWSVVRSRASRRPDDRRSAIRHSEAPVASARAATGVGVAGVFVRCTTNPGRTSGRSRRPRQLGNLRQRLPLRQHSWRKPRRRLKSSLSNYLDDPQGRRRHLRLQQQEVLHHHAGRRLRRQRRRSPDHGQRNGARRDRPRRRSVATVVDQDLDCPAGPERRRLRANPAGQLGGYFARCVDGNQLPDHARRPVVHRTRSVSSVGQLIGKLTAPFERLFGFVSLGTAMAQRIDRFGQPNNF